MQESIERESGRLVKPWFIARVLRKVMDLRYTKVRKIPYQANLDRSLVLRHLYAQKLFELLPTEARIFNVDESWVNDLSWNQRQWNKSSERNCVSIKSVSPRLSLIVAIDNYGNIYAALTQVNTDQDVF